MKAGSTMDASTQASLIALSTAVQNAKSSGVADPEMENLAALVKQKIESQLLHLRGSSAELAEKILKIIDVKGWAELPTPAELELKLDKINEVAAALAQVADNVVTDIGEIFRILMELQRKNMLDNRKAQVQSNETSIEQAKGAIREREDAAIKQFAAEIVSSVAQLASAAVSGIGAAKSLGKVKESIKSSRDAFDMTVGKSDDKSGNLHGLKAKTEQAGQQLKFIEKKLEKVPADAPDRPRLEQEYMNSKSVYEQAKADFETENQLVEQKQAESMNTRLKADAQMQIWKAVAEITSAVANTPASGIKLLASQQNLEADRRDVDRSLAEKSYQASQEVVSTTRETLRGLLNSIQALEQILSNMNSLLARNTA